MEYLVMQKDRVKELDKTFILCLWLGKEWRKT